jgi:hypothetical protein
MVLKEHQIESKALIIKIYRFIPRIKIFYLVRNRPEGLRDLGIEDAIKNFSKGLKEYEYFTYKNPETPTLLFDKGLLIQTNVFYLSPQFKQIKVFPKNTPFVYEVKPNIDIINKYIDSIEMYLTGELEQTEINLEPLVESKYLRLLPTGSCQIKINDKWSSFCDVELNIDSKGKITSNTGKLIFFLIEQKRNNEGATTFGKDYVMESLGISSESEYKNAIGGIQRNIREKKQRDKAFDKVLLAQEKYVKSLEFLNIVQDKEKIENKSLL